MTDPKAIIDELWVVCTSVRTEYDLYRDLFETNPRNWDLYRRIAPLSFGDIRLILAEHLFIQFCKITDLAGTGKRRNLTTNYILSEIPWPDDVGQKLRKVNERLMVFRQYVEPARSRRIAHIDLPTQIERLDNLGTFPEGADRQFFRDLQRFIDIAYSHFKESTRPIAIGMSTDTYKLVRALEESVVFHRCSKCTEGERAVAVLDYEDRSA